MGSRDGNNPYPMTLGYMDTLDSGLSTAQTERLYQLDVCNAFSAAGPQFPLLWQLRMQELAGPECSLAESGWYWTNSSYSSSGNTVRVGEAPAGPRTMSQSAFGLKS